MASLERVNTFIHTEIIMLILIKNNYANFVLYVHAKLSGPHFFLYNKKS